MVPGPPLTRSFPCSSSGPQASPTAWAPAQAFGSELAVGKIPAGSELQPCGVRRVGRPGQNTSLASLMPLTGWCPEGPPPTAVCKASGQCLRHRCGRVRHCHLATGARSYALSTATGCTATRSGNGIGSRGPQTPAPGRVGGWSTQAGDRERAHRCAGSVGDSGQWPRSLWLQSGCGGGGA